MSFKRNGSIGLSVLLTILIIISGSVFMNSISARQTFSEDNMREKLDEMDLSDTIAAKMGNIDLTSELTIGDIDLSSMVDLSGKIAEVTESQGYSDLMDRYAEYLSDYMLNGSSDKEITDEELNTFISPFVEDWTSSLLNSGLITEDFQQSLIYKIVENMSSAFVSVDDYISDNLEFVLRLGLSAATRNISLILTIVFLALLLLTARPRRFSAFAGAATALTGLASIGISQVIYSLFSDVFVDVSFKKLLSLLLEDYSDRISNLSIIVAGVGAVLFIAGLIVAIITRRRKSW